MTTLKGFHYGGPRHQEMSCKHIRKIFVRSEIKAALAFLYVMVGFCAMVKLVVPDLVST
jgi:hypothetical protein